MIHDNAERSIMVVIDYGGQWSIIWLFIILPRYTARQTQFDRGSSRFSFVREALVPAKAGSHRGWSRCSCGERFRAMNSRITNHDWWWQRMLDQRDKQRTNMDQLIVIQQSLWFRKTCVSFKSLMFDDYWIVVVESTRGEVFHVIHQHSCKPINKG